MRKEIAGILHRERGRTLDEVSRIFDERVEHLLLSQTEKKRWSSKSVVFAAGAGLGILLTAAVLASHSGLLASIPKLERWPSAKSSRAVSSAEKRLDQAAVAEIFLAGSTLRGLELTVDPGSASTVAKILQVEYADRPGTGSPLPQTRNLLGQLRSLEAMPRHVVLNLNGGLLSRTVLLRLLGEPEMVFTTSRSGQKGGSSIRGASARNLKLERKAKATEPKLTTVSLISAESEPGPPEKVEWLNYGAYGFGFSQTDTKPAGLRLKAEEFLGNTSPSPGLLVEKTRLAGQSAVWAVAVAPDGQTAALGLENSSILLANLAERKTGQPWAVKGGKIFSLAFTPQGDRLLVGCEDGTVRVWDVAGRKELASYHAHTGQTTGVAVSPDGRQALSGGSDGMAIRWDLESGREVTWLVGHESGVTSVDFSPDGERALTASNDRTIRLWNARSGELLRVFHGHLSGVQIARFSPDGQRMASGSGGPIFDDDGKPVPSLDQTVRIWDVNTGEELIRCSGHRDWVIGLAFSPDGKYIASSSGGGIVRGEIRIPASENQIRVWDAGSGAELAGSPPLHHIVRSIAFTPNGQRIISGCWDGTMRVWQRLLLKPYRQTPPGLRSGGRFQSRAQPKKPGGKTRDIEL